MTAHITFVPETSDWIMWVCADEDHVKLLRWLKYTFVPRFLILWSARYAYGSTLYGKVDIAQHLARFI
jgi:hypothetical protein